MRTFGSCIKALALFSTSSLLVIILGATAFGQAQRTFVAETGLDSNPCSLTAPCRTFAQAISETNAGGEVVALSSAGYGPFAITKALTVEAPEGVYAGITVNGGTGDGIDINAGTNDVVTLRGLTVNNLGSTGNGVVFNTAGAVHVESCVINGFTNGAGIKITGTNITIASILVKDTIARNNDWGILQGVAAADGVLRITMDHIRLDANNIGLAMGAQSTLVTVTGVMRDSSVSGNTQTGISLTAGNETTFGSCALDLESCLVTNNAAGINVQQNVGSATMSISNTNITDNATSGFSIGTGSTIFSLGDNTITGNGASTGTLTPLAAQ
jgi:hypothetical protein